jgi:hypothetical protein
MLLGGTYLLAEKLDIQDPLQQLMSLTRHTNNNSKLAILHEKQGIRNNRHTLSNLPFNPSTGAIASGSETRIVRGPIRTTSPYFCIQILW